MVATVLLILALLVLLGATFGALIPGVQLLPAGLALAAAAWLAVRLGLP